MPGGGSVKDAIKNPLRKIDKGWGDMSKAEKMRMTVKLLRMTYYSRHKHTTYIYTNGKETVVEVDAPPFVHDRNGKWHRIVSRDSGDYDKFGEDFEKYAEKHPDYIIDNMKEANNSYARLSERGLFNS